MAFLKTDSNGNLSFAAVDLTLSASNLTSGTIPDARFLPHYQQLVELI